MTPPVFSHGALRLYLLSLIEESPRHGYELIQALSERFGGTYIPSAGTVYPRLAKLEEDGLVVKRSDGRRSVYELTDAGRAELDARRGELGEVQDEVSDSVRRLADEVRAGVTSALGSLRAELAAAREAHGSPEAQGAHPGSAAGSATGSDDARAASRAVLAELDAAIAEFRQQVRTDARTAVARGGLGADVPALLRRGLAAVRAELLAALPGPDRGR